MGSKKSNNQTSLASLNLIELLSETLMLRNNVRSFVAIIIFPKVVAEQKFLSTQWLNPQSPGNR